MAEVLAGLIVVARAWRFARIGHGVYEVSHEPPAERMKEYQRSIKKSVREMDRERSALERQD